MPRNLPITANSSASQKTNACNQTIASRLGRPQEAGPTNQERTLKPTLQKECPDFGEVVVVVFSDEVKVVNEAEWLLKAWVYECLSELFRLESCELFDERCARDSKFVQQVDDIARVVIGFMSFAVLQVGRREILAILGKVVDTCAPQGLQIQKMTGLFLR